MRTLRFFQLGLLCAAALRSAAASAGDAVTEPTAPVEPVVPATSPRGEALVPSREIEPVDYPACPGTPSDDAIVAARGAFEAGNAAFNERSYTRALLYWEDAYRRDCTAHAMLKNLSRAYELDGQLRHAIKAIETYLELVPNSGEDEVLRSRVTDLTTRIAERDKPLAPPPAAAPAAESESAETTRSAPVVDSSAAEDSTPPATSRNAKQRDAWPLVFAGLGAGVIGLSTVQWLSAKGDEDAAASLCPSRKQCAYAVKRAGNNAVDREITWSIVGFGGGGVLLAGIVWFLVQEPTPEQAVVPFVGVDVAGVNWVGHF